MPTPKLHADAAARQRAYRQRERASRQARKGALPPCIRTTIGQARWKELTAYAVHILQTLEGEMEDYRDRRSEAWQESEKAEAFQQTIDLVQEALEAAQAIA
jgi:hypothetical protein